MASTQYQIFIRYLNESIGKPLTNKTSVEWIGAEELVELESFYNTNEKDFKDLKDKVINGYNKTDNNGNIKHVYLKISDMTKKELNIYTKCTQYNNIKNRLTNKDENIVKEICEIKTPGASDIDLYQLIIDESYANNPKYDMIFMYDGIAHITFQGFSGNEIPELYFERMKRIKLDPWFLHSTYISLKAAMTKAEELVNILGKDAVKIGKVVPLDQYIDIV